MEEGRDFGDKLRAHVRAGQDGDVLSRLADDPIRSVYAETIYTSLPVRESGASREIEASP